MFRLSLCAPITIGVTSRGLIRHNSVQRAHRAAQATPDPAQRPQRGVRVIDLSDKSAIVTGGARGIGRAIVLRLARQGADIAFLDRGPVESAEATRGDVEALGRRCFWVEGDVSDPEAAPALVARTARDGPTQYGTRGRRDTGSRGAGRARYHSR